MYSFRISALTVCLILVFFISGASGDVVYLKTGGKIEGKVIAQTETEVRVATKYGVVITKREDIKDIEITPTVQEIYKEKLGEISGDDAEAHYQLGLWCREQGLSAEAMLEFREALKL